MKHGKGAQDSSAHSSNKYQSNSNGANRLTSPNSPSNSSLSQASLRSNSKGHDRNQDHAHIGTSTHGMIT